MTATLEVLRGPLITVQDLGRPAAQRYGVPLGGAMDRFALEAANRLLGNAPDAAALEITAGGAAFRLLAPTLLALTGADLSATLDDRPLTPWTAVLARAGSLLDVPGRRGSVGARGYLALAGGVAAPLLLGSASTCLPGGFGGLDGRPLRAGDQIDCHPHGHDLVRLAGRAWPFWARPSYQEQPTLRVLPGPHGDIFAADALELLTQPYQVGQQANRMGYRLAGPALRDARPGNLPSFGVLPGAIQVPPDGAPILLMADAQPTGGYPLIALVIGPDLPLAAQLLPGDRLRFALTTIAEAHAAWRTAQDWLTHVYAPDETIELLGWAGAPA
jgi:biotin-dependent carboxylase-like uncharacterized protein